jgi:hypothetical protein
MIAVQLAAQTTYTARLAGPCSAGKGGTSHLAFPAMGSNRNERSTNFRAFSLARQNLNAEVVHAYATTSASAATNPVASVEEIKSDVTFSARTLQGNFCRVEWSGVEIISSVRFDR